MMTFLIFFQDLLRETALYYKIGFFRFLQKTNFRKRTVSFLRSATDEQLKIFSEAFIQSDIFKVKVFLG